jgi:DNA-directed RNA polymerase specialized sigma24 family protein
MDACDLIKETEEDIKRLEKKKKIITQTSVTGSNPEFPYNPMHFKVQGATFTVTEDNQLRMEEALLKERRQQAEQLKESVEEWMLTIPIRMQRIIRYRFFEGMTWEETASRLGRKSTGESVKKEYQRFMKK